MTDHETLSAAAAELRTRMRRRQVEAQAAAMRAGDAWARPQHNPVLQGLALECDQVVYGQRAEDDDLLERLAAVLGDGWEPHPLSSW